MVANPDRVYIISEEKMKEKNLNQRHNYQVGSRSLSNPTASDTLSSPSWDFEEERSKQRNELPKSQREKSQDELSYDLGSNDPFPCLFNSMALIPLNIFLVIKYLYSCLPTCDALRYQRVPSTCVVNHSVRLPVDLSLKDLSFYILFLPRCPNTNE